jgi:hypothetical protein
VILTNADSGWGLAGAVMHRTLELIYDGEPEAEEDFRSYMSKGETLMKDQQKDWKMPPDPAEVRRLAATYRNAALGEVIVRPGKDEVVLDFGGWQSHMASKLNPDGTTSFITTDPSVRGVEFNAPAAEGTYTRLTLRDSQQTYEYVAAPTATK